MSTRSAKHDPPTRIDRPFLNAGRGTLGGEGISSGYFQTGPRYRVTRPTGDADWLLIVTQAGGGMLRHGRQQVQLRSRSVMLYVQDSPQDYATSPEAGTWTFMFAHVRPSPALAARHAHWPRPWPGLKVLSVNDAAVWREVIAAMTRTRRLLSSPTRGRVDLSRNALEAALMWCDEANPHHGATIDPRVRRAAEYARQHIDRLVTAEELAEAAGLSVSRLTALFRSGFGESPVKYTERLRLEHAAMLIATAGLSVKEAAAAVGYSDTYHFSRRFSQRLGRSPSSWKNRGRDDGATGQS